MSDDAKTKGNILVNPTSYADRLASLELEHDRDQIERIELHLAHLLRLGGAISYIDDAGNHVIEDRDGIRPFPDGAEFPAPPRSAELDIRELAFHHGVQGARTSFDNWTEAVTALAGDDIRSDEVELILVELRRLGVEDGVDITKLHARYLEEISRV